MRRIEMILTITRGNVFEEYKLFHFEYAVLLEFLNDKVGGYTLYEKKMIAQTLCLYGLVAYCDVEFKLKRV
jgi:hypothetical protein